MAKELQTNDTHHNGRLPNGHPDEPGERFMVDGCPVRELPDDKLTAMFISSQRGVTRMNEVLGPQFLEDFARAHQLAAVFAYESERRVKLKKTLLTP